MHKGPILASIVVLIILATQLAWGFRWASFTNRLTNSEYIDDKYSDIMQARDDTIWVVWDSYVNGWGVIYYAKSSDMGKTWSTPSNITQANPIPEYDNTAPEIMQTNDGVIWVIWCSNRPVPMQYDFEIYYRTSPNNGATWSQTRKLTSNSVDDTSPSIVQAMNSTIYVAWAKMITDTSEIMLMSSSNNGQTWSAPIQLTNDNYDDTSPSIIQTRDGKIWVAWDRRGISDLDLYYRIYDGTQWLAEQKYPQCTPRDEVTPSLVGAANGVVWMFWDEGDLYYGIPNSVYYSYTSDNGKKWENSALLSLPDGNNHSWPSATHTKDSTIWVVWASNRTGDFELYYRTSLTGDLTGPENPPGSGNYPSDGIVNQYDLAFVGKAYGTKEGDSLWSKYQIADITGPVNPPDTLWYPPDGVISVYDLAAIGKNYGKV